MASDRDPSDADPSDADPSDADRQHLYAALETNLGEGPATTLMRLLPPQGWDDVTRRPDLVLLRTELRGEMAGLRGEIAEVRGEMRELRGEMAELRAELKGEMAELRTELKTDMAALGAKVDGQVPRFLWANVPLVFGTAGLVFAAIKVA
ncbi:MAG TPA: hypothetical protein VM390_07485 [Acidimicrobiales bacterium]|nr:hypothetical protein [Acidimicrobiales bacterium]